jgi:gamma-glutamyl phosphate reductase
MSAASDGRFALAPGVVFQELPQGDAVLLAAQTETYYSLSQTGSIIVRAVQEDGVEAAIRALEQRFDVDRATAREDVQSLLDDLVKEDLLHPAGSGSAPPSSQPG